MTHAEAAALISGLMVESRFLGWGDNKRALRRRADEALTALEVDLDNPADRARLDAAVRAHEDALRRLPYHEYLQSEHWQLVRRLAQRAGAYRCRLCSAPQGLQVHHRTYAFLGCEGDEDVVVLCGDCHQLFHENRELVR